MWEESGNGGEREFFPAGVDGLVPGGAGGPGWEGGGGPWVVLVWEGGAPGCCGGAVDLVLIFMV